MKKIVLFIALVFSLYVVSSDFAEARSSGGSRSSSSSRSSSFSGSSVRKPTISNSYNSRTANTPSSSSGAEKYFSGSSAKSNKQPEPQQPAKPYNYQPSSPAPAQPPYMPPQPQQQPSSFWQNFMGAATGSMVGNAISRAFGGHHTYHEYDSVPRNNVMPDASENTNYPYANRPQERQSGGSHFFILIILIVIIVGIVIYLKRPKKKKDEAQAKQRFNGTNPHNTTEYKYVKVEEANVASAIYEKMNDMSVTDFKIEEVLEDESGKARMFILENEVNIIFQTENIEMATNLPIKENVYFQLSAEDVVDMVSYQNNYMMPGTGLLQTDDINYEGEAFNRVGTINEDSEIFDGTDYVRANLYNRCIHGKTKKIYLLIMVKNISGAHHVRFYPGFESGMVEFY